MGFDVVLIAVGAVALAYSGNRLVDFAVTLAAKARLTPAVIGLTIVAAGTSAPELAVSLTGAPLVVRRRTLTRGGGSFLLFCYACFVAWLVWSSHLPEGL